MRLSIRAHFVLGVYVGHRQDQSSDPFPDPARLHSALLHAAATGSQAVRKEGRLEPSAESIAALEWLESNPPNALKIPTSTRQFQGAPIYAFRKIGLFSPRSGNNGRIEQKPKSDGFSVKEPMVYSWHDVDEEIAVRIRSLVADIAFLGDAESPVIFDFEDDEPTHIIDATASPLNSQALDVRTPTPGRTSELIKAFKSVNRSKPPKRDNLVKDEKELRTLVSQQCVEQVTYLPLCPEGATSNPWDELFLLEILDESPIPENEIVSWCLAVHRTMVKAIGLDVPPIITGHFPRESSERRPANQLAIHFLPAESLRHHDIHNPAFAIMVPRDATSVDRAAVVQALSRITKIYSRHGHKHVAVSPIVLDAEKFWPEPKEGFQRRWITVPLAVTEGRTPKHGRKTSQWTFEDAALLSLGHVFRDDLAVDNLRGDKGREMIKNAVSGRGARIHSAEMVPTNIRNYTHKINKGSFAQCWRGVIELGDLGTPTGLIAIGQTRHLGGGLLMPFDVPKTDAHQNGEDS